MSRKVLITSLGNLSRLKVGPDGKYTKDEQIYNRVLYNIHGRTAQSCYIAEAYLMTEEADHVILIGTAGSDWVHYMVIYSCRIITAWFGKKKQILTTLIRRIMTD